MVKEVFVCNKCTNLNLVIYIKLTNLPIRAYISLTFSIFNGILIAEFMWWVPQREMKYGEESRAWASPLVVYMENKFSKFLQMLTNCKFLKNPLIYI